MKSRGSASWHADGRESGRYDNWREREGERMKGGAPNGGQLGPPGAGGNEDAGSTVTPTGTSGTGVGASFSTEQAPGERTRAGPRVDGPAGPRAGGG